MVDQKQLKLVIAVAIGFTAPYASMTLAQDQASDYDDELVLEPDRPLAVFQRDKL